MNKRKGCRGCRKSKRRFRERVREMNGEIKNKIPLVTIVSASHANLYLKYFEPSFKRNISNFQLKKYDIIQSCTGDYGSEGWGKSMIHKLQVMLDAMKNNEFVLYSDCDVVFFKDFYDDIMERMKDLDIIWQNNYDGFRNRCAGFFMVRSSELTRQILKAVMKIVPLRNSDQKSFNSVLQRPGALAREGFLPKEYWCVAEKIGTRCWMGDEDKIEIPEDIVMFHGNWTDSLLTKERLMKEVIKKHAQKHNR